MEENKQLKNRQIVEILIRIKDNYDLTLEETIAINYACNNLE